MNTAAPTLAGRIITQAIAVVVFVILPIVITLMVPFTNLEFRRSGSGASVTVQRFVLMFVPWQSLHVDNVNQIRADVTSAFRYPDTAENRRKGRAGTYSHATGQVAIVSAGPEVIVQAMPELAKEIEARFQRFLADKDAAPVQVPVYASWWLSYVLGGVVTFLCAFYLICSLLAVLSLPFNWLRSSRSGK